MYISIQWLQFCPAEDAVIRSARSQIKEDIMEGEEMPVVMPLCGSNSGGSNKIKMRLSDGSSSKRRFSDEQVRSLECTFEAQTKLEPRRKAQLAGELGLQPRQVAVWFQNRRARWKSKELERECAALRADYDALLSSFESLEKEKQSLAATLQKLTELLEKPEDSNSGHPGDGNSERKENRDPISCLPVEGSLDRTLVGCSDEGELVGYMGQQEDRLCVSEPIISPSVPAEGRCCFDTSGCLSDQSCGTPTDWWELWPLN